MKPTVNGVYYNVAASPIEAIHRGYRYKFSSQSHLDKFLLKVKIKEEWLNDSLSRRFKFRIDAPLIADLQLYMQIESRGFYVEDVAKNLVFDSPEQLQVVVTDFYGWDGEWQEDGLRQPGSCCESKRKQGRSTETLMG